jgi:UPF0716 protein FxsA
LIAIGGTLLLAPGFVTDIFGVILLVPPTRALVRRFLGVYLGRRFVIVGAGRFGGPGPGTETPQPPPRHGYDFEGTAEEIDGEDPQLGR